MTTVVTVSEFRNNLAEYLDLLIKNKKISITDGRKGKVLVNIAKSNEEFDWDNHLKEVEKLAGSGLFASDEKDRKKLRAGINKRLASAKTR